MSGPRSRVVRGKPGHVTDVGRALADLTAEVVDPGEALQHSSEARA
jgi:hypothetical protein